MENDVLYNRIMNVVHGEYGSGSTATANPEGEATDALEKIQIGGDIYSISGGGGGGGGMILTLSQVGDDTVLDKNYKEIKAAIDSGIIPFYLKDGDVPGTKEMSTAFGYGEISGNYIVKFSVRSATASAFISDSDEGVLVLYPE